MIGIEVKGNEGNRKIVIKLDGDPNLNIDHCALINRRIGHIIEEEDLMKSKYSLEVTSPGVDQPLVVPRQYLKNVGREVKIVLKNGEKLKGKLERSLEESIVVVDSDKNEKELKFEVIQKTNVLVSFN